VAGFTVETGIGNRAFITKHQPLSPAGTAAAWQPMMPVNWWAFPLNWDLEVIRGL
jgi:hypothetical protein